MKNLILQLEHKPVFNSRLALARTILALSTLLLLCFNDIHESLRTELLSEPGKITISPLLQCYSIFHVFPPVLAKSISILILLFSISGFLPQISALLHAWVAVSVCNSFLVIEGGDQVASNLCLLIAPLCMLDNRINQWQKVQPIVSNTRKAINVFANVYYCLIVVQVAVIYLHAAVGKLYQDEWLNGTGMYYWFTNNVFGAPIYLQWIYSKIALSVFVPLMSWGVIIFELGLFACILATSSKLRRAFLISGIIFHFGIAITHGLPIFFFAMTGALILYLDSENWMLGQILKVVSLIKLKRTSGTKS